MRQTELHLEQVAPGGVRGEGRHDLAEGNAGGILRTGAEAPRAGRAGRVETGSESGMESQSATVAFVIPGTPVGKGRPKFARRGNFVSAYTPERTASYENLVKVAAHRAMNSLKPFAGAVKSTITLRLIPPASWSKKKRMAAFSGDLRPVGKPDVDNVVKGIFDAMNNIVFLDDKQVVELTVRKLYAERAEAEVEVRAL